MVTKPCFAFGRRQAAVVVADSVLRGIKGIEEGGKKEVQFFFVLLHAISKSFPQVTGLRAGQRGCWVVL